MDILRVFDDLKGKLLEERKGCESTLLSGRISSMEEFNYHIGTLRGIEKAIVLVEELERDIFISESDD